MGRIWLGWLVVASSWGGSARGDDGGSIEVRIAIDADGRIDSGEVVARVGRRIGREVPRAAEATKLPVVGLSAGLVRTFLEEQLGPGVKAEVVGNELVLRLGPEVVAQPEVIAGRLRALADGARLVAARSKRYGMHALPSYRPADPARPTICLLHGINSNASSFHHLIGPLEAAGFGLVVYDFPFNRRLDASATQFRDDWARFRRDHGESRPWAIVSHSMGGLLARAYVEGPDYGGDVAELVMIGPPNEGSAVARAQTVLQFIEGSRAVEGAKGRGGAAALSRLSEGMGEAAEDMRPGSGFLRRLNARPRRAGVGYHILAGDIGLISAEARAGIAAQLGMATRGRGLLGGLARVVAGDLAGQLDELTDGAGDGCVAVASTRLDGVADHVAIHANHVELIRGPLLYPDPGPVACLPFVLDRLRSMLPTVATGPAR